MWQSNTDVRYSSNNQHGKPSMSSSMMSWKNSTTSIAAAKITSLQKGLLKRAVSFQFLNKKSTELCGLDENEKAFIKLRYKDIAKHVIWPSCPLPDQKDGVNHNAFPPIQVLSDAEKSVLMPNIEDHRTPYPRPAINSILRSDSEDSSDAESLVRMTRL